MSKSKSNRQMRIVLARIFGNGCMFKKSHAEYFIEKLGTIKTYKKFKEEKHYTSKQVIQLEHFMTLHHLKHRSEGGLTTEENGAIINELAHRYMHSLPRNQEEIINNYIRKWKAQNYTKCDIELIDEIEEPYELSLAEISFLPYQLEVKKYNRNKNKIETKKLINDYYKEKDYE